MKTLIVDDVQSMRQILKIHLRDLNITDVEEAADGEAALSLLKNLPVDLILTDLHMKGMSGMEFIRTLRSKPDFKKIPVIVISTEQGKGAVVEAAKLGIGAFLIKPFTVEMLSEALKKSLPSGALS